MADKNINTTNLSLAYANMTEANFKANLEKLGFKGDFKKAYDNLKSRAKVEKEYQDKKAKRLNK